VYKHIPQYTSSCTLSTHTTGVTDSFGSVPPCSGASCLGGLNLNAEISEAQQWRLGQITSKPPCSTLPKCAIIVENPVTFTTPLSGSQAVGEPVSAAETIPLAGGRVQTIYLTVTIALESVSWNYGDCGDPGQDGGCTGVSSNTTSAAHTYRYDTTNGRTLTVSAVGTVAVTAQVTWTGNSIGETFLIYTAHPQAIAETITVQQVEGI
ncbi:MAG: hypothetical protein ACREF7_01895, partial [Candidatus Saccharimonadales bacterium]